MRNPLWFQGAWKLNDIKIPSGLETIGKDAFENCGSLKSLTLPDSVTEIGGSSSKNCEKLENVVIPESMKKIGKTAFDGTSLKDLTIPISLNANGHRFKGSGYFHVRFSGEGEGMISSLYSTDGKNQYSATI